MAWQSQEHLRSGHTTRGTIAREVPASDNACDQDRRAATPGTSRTAGQLAKMFHLCMVNFYSTLSDQLKISPDARGVPHSASYARGDTTARRLAGILFSCFSILSEAFFLLRFLKKLS